MTQIYSTNKYKNYKTNIVTVRKSNDVTRAQSTLLI